MTGQTVILRGPAQCAQAKRLIDLAPRDAVVNIREAEESRTSQQNRTLHMWFGEIARQSDDLDATEIKGMCHRRWGLAIRLRDPQFAWVWKHSGENLNYEQQCSLLASGVLNVSSGMTMKELSEYLDGMSRYFRSNGYRLTDPEVKKYEAAG
jgi:hypothetical protein